MLQALGKKMKWESVYRKNYEGKAFSFSQWVGSAHALLASAKLLEPRIVEIWENRSAHFQDQSVKLTPSHEKGPYFMLIAFAVENMFKAAIVREHSKNLKIQYNADKKFPKKLKSHDLIALAKEARFDYSLEEEDMLRRLTRHAIWEGRYPVPLKYEESSGLEVFDDGQERRVSWFGESDVGKLSTLILNIDSRLELGVA